MTEPTDPILEEDPKSIFDSSPEEKIDFEVDHTFELCQVFESYNREKMSVMRKCLPLVSFDEHKDEELTLRVGFNFEMYNEILYCIVPIGKLEIIRNITGNFKKAYLVDNHVIIEKTNNGQLLKNGMLATENASVYVPVETADTRVSLGWMRMRNPLLCRDMMIGYTMSKNYDMVYFRNFIFEPEHFNKNAVNTDQLKFDHSYELTLFSNSKIISLPYRQGYFVSEIKSNNKFVLKINDDSTAMTSYLCVRYAKFEASYSDNEFDCKNGWSLSLRMNKIAYNKCLDDQVHQLQYTSYSVKSTRYFYTIGPLRNVNDGTINHSGNICVVYRNDSAAISMIEKMN